VIGDPENEMIVTGGAENEHAGGRLPVQLSERPELGHRLALIHEGEAGRSAGHAAEVLAVVAHGLEIQAGRQPPSFAELARCGPSDAAVDAGDDHNPAHRSGRHRVTSAIPCSTLSMAS